MCYKNCINENWDGECKFPSQKNKKVILKESDIVFLNVKKNLCKNYKEMYENLRDYILKFDKENDHSNFFVFELLKFINKIEGKNEDF